MKQQFCQNCSQKVSGDIAMKAADPDQQFCCACGDPLKDGKCQNPVCQFKGQAPDCSSM